MTPLFDANAHPWLGTAQKPDGFSGLAKQLRASGFSGACAVGLPGKAGFEHAPFYAACRAANFYPVAAWPDTAENAIEARFAELAAIGYGAIKIHPRLSGLSVREKRFAATLKAAAAAGFVVFHCSYQFSSEARRHPVDPLPPLMDAIGECPGLRLVLLHGGTVEALRYAEAIRAYPGILLDMSFTMNRFEGSSLDLDIAYLMRSFDRRICIGSDFPDYTPAQLRSRFEKLAEGLPQDKKDNIGGLNITGLLEIVPPATPQSKV